MSGCCTVCTEHQLAGQFPGVLTAAEAARFVAGHPGMAVSLGGLVARVVWSQADTAAADSVAVSATARLLNPNAPGRAASKAGGADANACPLPGGTDMHDLTDPPQLDAVRGKQLAAVLVVGKLLELDLPEACGWDIRSDGITIQLAVQHDIAESIDALTKWAEFLGTDPRADGEPYTTAMGRLRRVEMTAVYRHLKVRVFDGVPVEQIPAEWLAERQAS